MFILCPTKILGDPIDKKYTEVGSSRKYSSAGESVFAKIDIPEKTVVTLMSGIVTDSGRLSSLYDNVLGSKTYSSKIKGSFNSYSSNFSTR
jgi:hypothetical protein